MNRGDLERPQMQQQMMAGSYNWLNMNNMHPPSQRPSPFLSSSSSSILPQYSLPTSLPLVSYHGNQELPESLSQLLLSGLVGDENRCSFSHFQSKKMDMSWEDQTLFPSSSVHAVDVKQERPESMYVYGHGNDEFQAIRSQWGQFLPASSPRSCVTNFSSNILDFSHPLVEERSQQPEHSSESIGKATGAPFKKAKVQSSSVQSSTFKVRKEKLGDRITALHQLVSPFGKTDTASVLLEAIGYIRFLQSQIEALSSPYLATAPSGNIRQPVQGDRNCIFPEDPGQLLNDTFMKRRGAPEKDAVDGPKKDLRTRGLCLVPISCTQLIGSENGAAFSAPNLGGGFQ